MKKYISVILIAIIAFTSCEQDSICIDATTPSLLIRFNDIDDVDEYKSITLDTIWAADKEVYATNQTVDSIYIPLDINENFTVYNFNSDDLIDQIKLAYTRNDVYVGRACGYKIIYEDLQLESNTNNWIKNIEINYTTIDNDTTAQVTIFH